MQAVLFDMDDTLYDLSRHRAVHLRRAWSSWLGQLSPTQADGVVAAAVQERIFFPDMASFLYRHGVTDVTQREKLIDASKAHWFADLQLDSGVPALLDRLASRYRLGLITNGPVDIQSRKIAHFGLARWFQHMTISAAYGAEKPAASIFLDMLDKLSVSASDAVMVGDNPLADIAGAQGVGMRAVWIRHPHVVYPPEIAPAWQTIAHVTELDTVLGHA